MSKCTFNPELLPSKSDPVVAVERTIVDGLAYMPGLDVLAGVEICNRAGDF